MIFGCEWIRKDLERGAGVEDILEKANAKLAAFRTTRRKYLLCR